MSIDPQDLDRRLAELNDYFKEAKAETPCYGDELPPVGTYETVLRSVEFFEGKKTGAGYLKMIYEVVHDPGFEGHEINKIYCLEPHKEKQRTASEVMQRLGFLKKDLATLGVAVDSDEFSFNHIRPGNPMWDGLLDSQVEIAVVASKKTNPDTGEPYRNAYVNFLIAGPMPKSDISNEPLDPRVFQASKVFEKDGESRPDERIPF
jgi:hypothetical protein